MHLKSLQLRKGAYKRQFPLATLLDGPLFPNVTRLIIKINKSDDYINAILTRLAPQLVELECDFDSLIGLSLLPRLRNLSFRAIDNCNTDSFVQELPQIAPNLRHLIKRGTSTPASQSKLSVQTYPNIETLDLELIDLSILGDTFFDQITRYIKSTTSLRAVFFSGERLGNPADRDSFISTMNCETDRRTLGILLNARCFDDADAPVPALSFALPQPTLPDLAFPLSQHALDISNLLASCVNPISNAFSMALDLRKEEMAMDILRLLSSSPGWVSASNKQVSIGALNVARCLAYGYSKLITKLFDLQLIGSAGQLTQIFQSGLEVDIPTLSSYALCRRSYPRYFSVNEEASRGTG
jgi:hypothetical protein